MKKLSMLSVLIGGALLAGCNGSGGNATSSQTTTSQNVKTNKTVLAQSSSHPVTAYVLMEDGALDYLQNTLLSQVSSGEVTLNRVVISFVNPNFDMTTYTKNADNLDNLLSAAGILPASGVNSGDGTVLKNVIAALHQNNVQVYFAVGGWAYSCYDPKSPKSNCTTNYPLTNDMSDNFKAAVPGVDLTNLSTNIGQQISGETQDYTTAWVSLVNSFGGDGVDLDYEENWFASEITYYYGSDFRPSQPTWSATPNGPFILPLSVIKYGTYLKELEISSSNGGLAAPTTAAPAPAAYNIHNAVGGAMYWCPVQDKNGTGVCNGDVSRSNVATVAGNLKGVLYDMAHYTDSEVTTYAGAVGSAWGTTRTLGYADLKDSTGQPLFSGVIDDLDAVNIMTYDLDDGYDGISASWCIGMVNGNFSSRDPSDSTYASVECSLPSQMQVLTTMFKQNIVGSKTVHLGFGLEAGFPNYPVNIDSSLPGGGNSDTTDGHYRWNDKFIAFDLPLLELTTDETNTLNTLSSTSQVSDISSAVDKHSEYLIVNDALFTRMTAAGADSMILWSLNNADYNQHLSKDTSWDYQQYLAQSWSSFGTTYSKFHYTSSVLGVLFDKSATPEQMLNIASTNLNK